MRAMVKYGQTRTRKLQRVSLLDIYGLPPLGASRHAKAISGIWKMH
jgi:hypothetical protein